MIRASSYRTAFVRFLALCLVMLFCVELISASDIMKQVAEGDIDASADNLEFIGNNIVATGHVVVKSQETRITCDKAIINTSTRDIEATGQVRFSRRTKSETEIEYWELKALQEDPYAQVTVNGIVTKPTGKQMLDVLITRTEAIWEGESAIGNLTTGIFRFDSFRGKYNYYYIEGEDAEREFNQDITVHDAKLTTCEYLLDGHEHYSITAGRVRLIPADKSRHISHYADHGNYDIWAYNCVFWIGRVPIFYIPVLYKPADEQYIDWQISGGHDSDWGYYVLTTKRIKLLDYPNTKMKIFADYYSKRGPAAGVEIKSRSEKTYTEAFVYGIRDSDGDQREGRFNIPDFRYDMRLSHLNHLTPRMDFRGHIEKLSDMNFLKDFFEGRDYDDPQPASYAALEYQFDRFSLAAYARPRMNDFYSVVQKLPELRMDIPRQELFHGLYYQGETSYANLSMKWRDYDVARTSGNRIDPRDYKTARLDTLHMLYYPFDIDWLHVVPRSGARLTYYARTSEPRIRQEDLETLFIVDDPDAQRAGNVRNYDGGRHNRLRVVGEFGIEMNTKIYQSWQDVKSPFWELDGLRHVIVPYINYNYIPEPNQKRDRLFYFDDIDRISEQNFIRVGWKNRLQTRRGEWLQQDIYNWATLENYFDFHFNRERSFDSHVGDFGTIFSFTPFPNLSVNNHLLVDLGEGQINRYSANVDYEFRKDWHLYGGYNFINDYRQRSVYSMGSSLTDITAGSSFARSYRRNSQIQGGIKFPINEKTRGELEMTYNFRDSDVVDSRFRLIRVLHCWEAAIEYGLRQRKNDNDERENKHTVMFTMTLTDIPAVKIKAKQDRGGGD